MVRGKVVQSLSVRRDGRDVKNMREGLGGEIRLPAASEVERPLGGALQRAP